MKNVTERDWIIKKKTNIKVLEKQKELFKKKATFNRETKNKNIPDDLWESEKTKRGYRILLLLYCKKYLRKAKLQKKMRYVGRDEKIIKEQKIILQKSLKSGVWQKVEFQKLRFIERKQ